MSASEQNGQAEEQQLPAATTTEQHGDQDEAPAVDCQLNGEPALQEPTAASDETEILIADFMAQLMNPSEDFLRRAAETVQELVQIPDADERFDITDFIEVPELEVFSSVPNSDSNMERIKQQLRGANNGNDDGGTGEDGDCLLTMKCVACLLGLADKKSLCACIHCGNVVMCGSCLDSHLTVVFPHVTCPVCRHEWMAVDEKRFPPGSLVFSQNATLIIRY